MSGGNYRISQIVIPLAFFVAGAIFWASFGDYLFAKGTEVISNLRSSAYLKSKEIVDSIEP